MDILGHKSLGSGPNKVIVMHEWLGDHNNYEPSFAYLNKKKYTWIFVDLRGYGLSKNLSGDYTCDEAAKDIIDLADYLNFDLFNLVGHSMSAMIAQRVAANVPSRVVTLVLVTPVPASGISVSREVEKNINRAISENQAAIEAIDARTGNRYSKTWLSKKLDIARRSTSSEVLKEYSIMFLTTDFSEDVINLNVPVRVLVGEYDIDVYQETNIRHLFSQWYPDLQLIKCQGAGHYPMLECPVYFASVLEDLIEHAL